MKTSCQLCQVMPAGIKPNSAVNIMQGYGGTTSLGAFFGIARLTISISTSVHHALPGTGVSRKSPTCANSKLTADSAIMVMGISQVV
jgi:hypothetical protein